MDLLRKLESRKFVRYQLLFSFFIARVYNTYRKAYRRLCAKGDDNLAKNIEESRETSEEPEHWRNFPPKWARLKKAELSVTVYMFWTLIRSTKPFTYFVAWLIYPSKKAQNCYVPGQIVFAPSLIYSTTVLLSTFHLIWRLIQRNTRPQIQNLSLALLQTDSLVESSYSTFRQTRYESQTRMTSEEKFIRDIMCFRYKYLSHEIYQLRPNRSTKAIKALQRRFMLITTSIGGLTLPVVAYISGMIFYFIFAEKTFLDRYPGCDEYLEQLRASNQMNSWGMTLTLQRIITIVMDLLENFCIWAESALAVTVIVPYILLTNYDFLLYWQHIDARIQRLNEELKLEWTVISPNVNIFNIYDDDESVREGEQSEEFNRKRLSHSSSDRLRQLRQWHALEMEICELQAEINDFFREKQIANVLISDTISITILIWMSQMIIWAYFSVACTEVDEPLKWQVAIFTLQPLFMFITMSIYMIKLNRRIRGSYLSLCSIMAYDRSQFKIRFIEVINFFTVRKQYAYSLFRSYPFESTTFLSIIGYTFSGGVLIQNFYANTLNLAPKT